MKKLLLGGLCMIIGLITMYAFPITSFIGIVSVYIQGFGAGIIISEVTQPKKKGVKKNG